MNISRRSFVAKGAAALATVTVLPLAGCDTTTIAEFVSLIANYGSQLATYFGATGIAGQITTLAGTIAADIANWQSGLSPAADAIQALTDLEGLINQIPIVSDYAPLIDLLLAAITGLLALLPNALTGPKAIKLKRSVTPFHYKDFSKKSMAAAKKQLTAEWIALSQTKSLKRQ